MTGLEIMGTLSGCYLAGWVLGKGLHIYQRFMEKVT